MRIGFPLAALAVFMLLAAPAIAQDGLSDECIQAGASSYEDCEAMLGGGAPAEEPVYEEPVYEEPAYEEPAYEEPAYEEPAYEEPAPEEPVFEEPAAPEPEFEETAPEEPVFEDSAPEESTFDEPATDEPVFDNSDSDAPAEEEAVPEDTPSIEEDTPESDAEIEPEAAPTRPAGIGPPVTQDAESEQPIADDGQSAGDLGDVLPSADDPVADLPPEELSVATEPLPEGATAEEAAPFFDSGKDGSVDLQADTGEEIEAPQNDEQAQRTVDVTPDDIVAANARTAQTLDAAPELVTPDNVTIVNTVENTYIYEVNNTTIINNSYDDRDRIFAGDDNYQFDQIGDNRFRETVYRDDGSAIVTVRDQYGNILERYRTDPDGYTYVFAYFDPNYYDDIQYWGDPGANLPPLRITLSIADYALDWRYADARRIAAFFAQPPVERARRIYSIDEVKRSARLRDSVRRLEVNNLNFPSGSANLKRGQIDDLSRIADAMWTLIEDNPAETFLIEGHTDATGSDRDNLLLSDKRASTIARVLTQYYDIPPENLATQGYGERYLRVNTQRANDQNRRVTIRRITPLVTPHFAGT